MLEVSFRVLVTHSFVLVSNFDAKEREGNFSGINLLQQGFQWNPASVIFVTIAPGLLNVEVLASDAFPIKGDALRVIKVPFRVGPSNLIEIATGGDIGQARVLAGNYELFFETGFLGPPDPQKYGDRDMWSRFTFVPNESPQAEIILADADLSPDLPLHLDRF